MGATSSPIRASVQHWSCHPGGPAGIQHRLQFAHLRRGQLAPGTARALGGQRLLPLVASARRHRFTDIRDTRKRLATSRSLTLASISSAAASRTRSRRARSAAVSPPAIAGYLMVPA
jgi:hypothetical protein